MNYTKELTIKNPKYQKFLREFKKLYFETPDLTTKNVVKNHLVTAEITAKEPGLLAGREEIESLFPNLQIKFHYKDGQTFAKNATIATIKDQSHKILQSERLILNILMRLSAIATQTNKLAKLAAPTKLAATRKTQWHYLDKKAVAIGGGLTHRLDLGHAILIKENHLAHTTITKALEKAAKTKTAFIEIEVENEQQALEASAHPKPITIMLDNFTPAQIKQTIPKIHPRHTIELSGGINAKNLHKYAKIGANLISMSALTDGVKSLDMSMRIS
ncbi:carboxylating nicotinate-nucleotide diphosphorylase [Candidatus Gracilibacteria bacterium]|nr:carboxylating nicotinate-nucleotide diphosphorylase [Candidatus Gracilibacteria bacterium]